MPKLTTSFKLFANISIFFLFVMFICRLLFLLFNPGYFANAGLTEFAQGIRFDFLTVVFGLLPVYILLFLPQTQLQKFLSFIRIYSTIVLSLFTLVNCIDVIYFKFTLKRSTWDIFRYASTGDELSSLIPQFLSDYWYMALIWILLIAFIYWMIKRIISQFKIENNSKTSKILYPLFMLFVLFVGIRGGFQLKPINIIDASRYTTGQNAPLMLNTPFTLMKTMGKEQLTIPTYFKSQEEALSYFNPVFESQSDSSFSRKNVVVIIMESLSKEYIGFFNDGKGYTPFLDSLFAHSMVIEHAYANGKRSIEALPAIFSGLPNLMNEAYNTSPYAGNKIESLASALKKEGYSSAFFHGGKNGTMGFDSYTNLAGFDAYYGLDEYPNKNDFDGSWGIYDLPYFQYFANEQSAMKEPFLSAIFSLSAHHPYKLPEQYQVVCKEGNLKIHPMICYSDLALRKYFEKVKNSAWYNNSIFLITADHTAQNSVEAYNNSMGNFAIPIVLFDPSKSAGQRLEITGQQSDISPSILDYLGLKNRSIYFGESFFDDHSNKFAINYLGGLYQYIDNESCIHYDGKKVLAYYDLKNDPLLKQNLKEILQEEHPSLLTLKSFIQSYNTRMIENKLTINE